MKSLTSSKAKTADYAVHQVIEEQATAPKVWMMSI